MARPEAIWRAAFEQSSQSLAVIDGRGLLAVWNESFASFFRVVSGARPDRLRASLFDYIVERGGLRLEYYAAEILLGGKPSAVVESPILAQDGSRRWFRLSLSLLRAEATVVRADGADTEPYLLCGVEDITDRVLHERRLREAKDEAEKATQTKSQFLATMSHEIRTPIQTILGEVELLQGTLLDGEQAEYAAQVRFSADVLLGLINDILDFSKIEAGKLDLETTDFDLRALVRQSVDMLVMDAHRKGLEVIVDVEECLPAIVRGDPARLRQIIVNLFKNAVKFTREGGVSLVVSRVQDESLPVARFEVKDTGIGVPAEVRDRLFTPFYQVDLAAARKTGGTGLGLAISRHLAGLMGGTVGLRANEGQGSVFWFEIPLVSPEHTSPPGRRASVPDTRLLVVDDHAGARAFAARTARSAGWLVEEAGSGEEALSLLVAAATAGRPFELCLVDQNMPQMDGWRLASEITGDDRLAGLHLVLMVPEGSMGADAKMKLLRWFDAYLSKPLRPAELLDTLEHASNTDVELLPAEEAPGARSAPAEPEESFDAEILLAEDHEVNRELFTLLLQKLGCTVTAARDGAEAVEIGGAPRPEGRVFDLVLTDIFMPRMNGYEAARALRAKGYRGPIVAVTASALKGEREKCLAAGMDDILVKPFKKKDLAALLGAWLPVSRGGHHGAAVAAPAPSPAPVPPAEPARTEARSFPATDIFDWEGVLDTFLGQRGTVLGLLGRFLEKARVQVEEELPAALADADLTRFREVAHSLKGASWNLAARRLGDAALAAEKAGKEGSVPDAASSLAALRLALADFTEAVRARMAAPDA